MDEDLRFGMRDGQERRAAGAVRQLAGDRA